MSLFRLGTWVSLTMLVVTNTLLVMTLLVLRHLHANQTHLTNECVEAVGLLRTWSVNLADLDTRLRETERQEVALAQRQKLLTLEIDALKVFRQSLKKSRPKLLSPEEK